MPMQVASPRYSRHVADVVFFPEMRSNPIARMTKTTILVVKVDRMSDWLSINTVLPLLPLRIHTIFSLETTRLERPLASLYLMTSCQFPMPPPRITNMDASVFISRPFTITDLAGLVEEILRTIATLNTRAVRAERLIV